MRNEAKRKIKTKSTDSVREQCACETNTTANAKISSDNTHQNSLHSAVDRAYVVVIIAPQNHIICLVVLNNGFQIFNWNARSHRNHLINIPIIFIGIPIREAINGYSDNIYTKENPLEFRFIKAALYFRINETHIRLFKIGWVRCVLMYVTRPTVCVCLFFCRNLFSSLRLTVHRYDSCVVVGDLCVKLRWFFKKTARIATL